ncbi:MAG: hypothetical protein JSU72_11000 [Deltaproteobacteria bacterium]|nr:MAG: hypothetical protein JSU72_11000 [Deltaproteobacteria bacterium]
MDLRDVWRNLEKTASAMERGEGDWNQQVLMMQAAIRQLVNFSPEDILSEAEQSRYPTKAMVKFLVYEGQRIEGVSVVKLQGICDYWNETMAAEQGLVTFPVTM